MRKCLLSTLYKQVICFLIPKSGTKKMYFDPSHTLEGYPYPILNPVN
jgi:hypothetical protein